MQWIVRGAVATAFSLAILAGLEGQAAAQACEATSPPVIETSPYKFEGELCLASARLGELGVARLRVRYRYGAMMGEPLERFALAWDASREGADVSSVRFRAALVTGGGAPTGLFAVFEPDTIGDPGPDFGMSMSGSPSWDDMFVDAQGNSVSAERAKDVFRPGFALSNLEVIHISTNAGSEGDASAGSGSAAGGSEGGEQGGSQPGADPTPECRTAADCGNGRTCSNGSCVGNGQLRFTLTWNHPGDMDLHVMTPDGARLYYGNRSGSGGELDRDDTSGTGPENVFWQSTPPPGEYLVCVKAYDIDQPTSFELAIQRPDGTVQTHTGTRSASDSSGNCVTGSPHFVTAVTVGGGAAASSTAGTECTNDAGCGPGRACSNGYCVGNGQLRFTLTWDQPGDMDLHVMTPDGSHLYYGNRRSGGAELDRDDQRGTGPENVFWTDAPPPGRYTVCVVPYRVSSTTSFTLAVQTPDGRTRQHTGSRSSGAGSDCSPGSASYVTAIDVSR